MLKALFPWTRAIAASVLVAALGISGPVAGAEEAPAWDSIRKEAFAGREILDAAGKIDIEAPIRADDAAFVPITIKMPAEFAGDAKTLTLIVDKNPAPIMGVFNYGPAAGNGARMLSTRVRIDQYSDVRVVVETTDGKFYMASRFVKASGGCSAPASKDLETALKSLGKIQIKSAIRKSDDGLTQEAQVMLKHPNVSGLAMDQLTREYPPARYVSKLSVTTGGKLIFEMTGSIGISEDPNLRFTYQGDPSEPMEVKAEDSDGVQFVGRSGPSPS